MYSLDMFRHEKNIDIAGGFMYIMYISKTH